MIDHRGGCKFQEVRPIWFHLSHIFQSIGPTFLLSNQILDSLPHFFSTISSQVFRDLCVDQKQEADPVEKDKE